MRNMCIFAPEELLSSSKTALHHLPSPNNKYHACTKHIKPPKKCFKIIGNTICLCSVQVLTQATGSMSLQGGWATQGHHWAYMDMFIFGQRCHKGTGLPSDFINHIWTSPYMVNDVTKWPQALWCHWPHSFDYLSGGGSGAVIQQWQVAGVVGYWRHMFFFFFTVGRQLLFNLIHIDLHRWMIWLMMIQHQGTFLLIKDLSKTVVCFYLQLIFFGWMGRGTMYSILIYKVGTGNWGPPC